jgi:phospholipase/lecithinase/hemolysin
MKLPVFRPVAAALFITVAGLSSSFASFTGIVSFGDSLSDLGNTVAEFDGLTDGENILYDETGYNNAFYDVGRWSNGSVWVENLASSLGLPALVRNDGTSLTGTNFAWGGSLSGTGHTDLIVNNLQTQIGDYLTILGTSGNSQPAMASTLFTVWSGGNDVIDLVTDGTTITPQQIADNIGTAISSLYGAGGRSFLVPNLPPLGDKPNFLNTSSEAPANAFVNSYNPVLEAELTSLETEFADIQIIRLDIYTLFSDILANPATYGFTNVTDQSYTKNSALPEKGSVVADPDDYLFWDGTHPTRIGHEIIGAAAYGAVTSAVPEPATTAAAVFVIAAVAIRIVRRRLRSPVT